ncbi:ELWxxDGT repeat protein [Herpetosiphon gulosus]|uniref:DUF7948 domain-containing protein n=1 Tax=Herpetosiphon gulosus TaxID=1973496 RepID=A0ABP9X9D4_9CHLR
MQQRTVHRRIRLIIFFWFVISLVLPSTARMAEAGAINGQSETPVASIPVIDTGLPPSVDRAFIPNQGQHDASVAYEALLDHNSVQFMANTVAYTMQRVSPTPATTQYESHRESYHLTMNFLGTATPVVTATQQVPGIFNDYRASDPLRWRSGLLRYQQITYQELYPGIDLAYTFDGTNLKSTYIVTPTTNPTRIQWSYTNAVPTLAADGALILNDLTMTPIMTESAPIAWQEIAGNRIPVHVVYQLDPNGMVGFTVGMYNAAYPLIIDPTMTSTVINGFRALAMDNDDQGNIYVAGCFNDFTSVRKYAADAKTFVYETLGSQFTCGNDIAVDAQGGVGVVSGRGYGSPDIAVYLRLNAMGGKECNPIELAAGNGASVHRILYNPANSRMYVVWASGSNGTSLTTFNGCTQTSSTAFNGFGPGMTVDADGTLYYTVASGSGANLVQKPLNSPQRSFATDGDGYVAVNDLYIVIAGWTPIGSFIAKHLHSGDFVGSYSLPIDTSITALALDSLGMISMSGSTQSTAFPLAGSTIVLDSNRGNGYVLKLDLQPLQSTLMYSVLIPHHRESDYSSSVSDIGLTDNQLVFVGDYTTGAAETDQNAYSRIGIVRGSNLSATFERTTTLPINSQGQEQLTVNTDSGWYDQPYLEYTLTINNDTATAQTLEIKSPESASQHINVWQTKASANPTQPLPTESFLSLDLTVAAHETVVIPLGIWVKPYFERNLVPEIWIRPQALNQPSFTVQAAPIHVPVAAIRPVVIVPGFIASLPTFFGADDYVLDPVFGTFNRLIAQLEFMGYETDQSLIKFAYPWYGRGVADPNDLANLGGDLKQRIDGWWNGKQRRSYIRGDSFDFITHSTGGLITRYYGSKLGGTSKMHSVFFVATPHLGAPITYASLEGLDPQMLDDSYDRMANRMFHALAVKAGCTTLNFVNGGYNFTVDSKQLYSYLHGEPCMTMVSYGIPGDEVPLNGIPRLQPGIPLMRELLPAAAAGKYLTLGNGSSAAGPANPVVDDLHSQVNTFINEVSAHGNVYSMFSYEKNTVVGYATNTQPALAPLWEQGTRVPRGWLANGSWEQRINTYTRTKGGDDTVPAASADLATISGSSKVKSFVFWGEIANNVRPLPASTATRWYESDSVQHTSYFNLEEGLEIVVGHLIKPTATKADIVALPPMVTYKGDSVIDIYNQLDSIVNLLIVECPVTILVTDAQGRRTGTDSQGITYTDIPKSFYTGHDPETGPDFLWLAPTTDPYTVTVTGIDPEPYQITSYTYSSTIELRDALWTGQLAPGEMITYTLDLTTRAPGTLLVDDHADPATLDPYRTFFPSQHVTDWSVEQQGIPSLDDLFAYERVIWATGTTGSLDPGAAHVLDSYQTFGGKVLLTGNDLEQELLGTLALTPTLHIQSALTTTTSRLIDGDAFLSGLRFSLNGSALPTPSAVIPTDSQSIAFYRDGDGKGHSAGIAYSTPAGGRLVYFGFDLASLASAVEQTAILSRTIQWLDTGAYPDLTTIPIALGDLNPGSASGINLPTATASISDTIFFIGTDPVHGSELWVSDGTPAGTRILKDIYPGMNGSGLTKLTSSGQLLFFMANDGIHGPELWVSDGTEIGTVMVADLWLGTNGSTPSLLTDRNGTLFFSAFDGLSGIELWSTDGTITGTVQVKDITLGAGSSNPRNLVTVNDDLFFTTHETGVNASVSLWRTDGTEQGTVLVRNLSQTVTNPNPTQLIAMDGILYFVMNTSGTGTELWRSDGTEQGTMLVADIAPGTASSNPDALTVVGSMLFFRATDGQTGTELWRSDGTTTGTILVADIAPGSLSSFPQQLTRFESTIFFSASDGATGAELWQSNGTMTGTSRIADIAPGAMSSSPTSMFTHGDSLFFSALTRSAGRELWMYNPAAPQLSLLADLWDGAGNASPRMLTAHPDGIFMIMDNGVFGLEPWFLSHTMKP